MKGGSCKVIVIPKGKRSQKLQLSLKVSLKLNWNFQRDGGEEWGFKPKETCRGVKTDITGAVQSCRIYC